MENADVFYSFLFVCLLAAWKAGKHMPEICRPLSVKLAWLLKRGQCTYWQGLLLRKTSIFQATWVSPILIPLQCCGLSARVCSVRVWLDGSTHIPSLATLQGAGGLSLARPKLRESGLSALLVSLSVLATNQRDERLVVPSRCCCHCV